MSESEHDWYDRQHQIERRTSELDALKEDCRKHIEKVHVEIGRRILAEGEADSLRLERDALKAELALAKEMLGEGYLHTVETDRYSLRLQLEKAREALKRIVNQTDKIDGVFGLIDQNYKVAQEALKSIDEGGTKIEETK